MSTERTPEKTAATYKLFLRYLALATMHALLAGWMFYSAFNAATNPAEDAGWLSLLLVAAFLLFGIFNAISVRSVWRSYESIRSIRRSTDELIALTELMRQLNENHIENRRGDR